MVNRLTEFKTEKLKQLSDLCQNKTRLQGRKAI